MFQVDPFPPINWFEELFYSTELWGLLGPATLVTITYLATKKDKGLGLIWYLVSTLGAVLFYMPMALENAFFNWHIIFIVFGGFLVFTLEYVK